MTYEGFSNKSQSIEFDDDFYTSVVNQRFDKACRIEEKLEMM